MGTLALTWSRGLAHALCTGAFAGLLFIFTAAYAQVDTEYESQEETATGEEGSSTAVELDRITVTGTRIRRTDVEGALPVTVIDREMIELSGESSLADFLRSLSFNSFGSYRTQSGSDDQGTAQINLRGLGSNRSLVLIDGRRMPKAPQSEFGYQNLNTIPMGSVERIEILSDGASAIYGSDAIGGVINVITRDDYRGWELMYGRAEANVRGSERTFGSAMWGWSNASSKIVASFSWNDREISYSEDFEWSKDEFSWYGNNFMTIDPESGQPNWDITAIPGGCTDTAAFFIIQDEYSLTGDVCTYEYSLVAADESSVTTEGALIRAEHEFSADWTGWGILSLSNTDSLGVYAPMPLTGLWWNLLIPVDSPNNPTNPASHMYDPAFGPNVPAQFFHRLDSLGTRDWLYDTRLGDVQVGATGWMGNVEVDFGLRRTRNTTDLDSLHFPVWETILEFIADGTYDLQRPRGNSVEVLDAMRTNYFDTWDFDQDEVFATVSWDLFEIRNEPVQWVFGVEWRNEFFHYDYSPLRFDVYGSLEAERDITSLYFETLFPLSYDLELSIAGRNDDYSDWGSDFSPKVALRWRATDELVLRASWGEGFRAPQLQISAAEPAEGFDAVDDPASCAAIGRDPDCWPVVRVDWTVSPELTSEHSEQYSLGLAWQPTDWINLTADYYDIELTDEINNSWWGDILWAEQRGYPVPAGLGVTRDANGLILIITAGWGNYGLVETSGLDLNVKLDLDLGPGRWHSNFQYSHVFDLYYTDAAGRSPNIIGQPGYPEARATLSNDYSIGDFSFSWNTHYIADQYMEFDSATEVGSGHLPTWVTHDLQASYNAPWDGKLTIGAQNAFDKQPPIGGPFWRDYNFDLYNGWGRTWYAQYTQTFE